MEKVIYTKLGSIEGVEQEDCLLFAGIPYAKPPVGELRFRAPRKMEPWEGVLRASHFREKCVQEKNEGFYEKEFYSNPAYEAAGSEDCLYLNIWTPKEKSEEKLPVAFWIHGGAFMGGYGSEMEFDGAAYAKKGVILVTVNYRLNVYGFLAHPWLNAESGDGISGNYGILDQIAALRFVYENIEAFGGDPENITVFGQSAGAMSVQTLLSTELTGNMIAKAIMQSGGSYGKGLHRDMPLAEAMYYGEKFVEYTGAKNLKELRQKSAGELQEVLAKVLELSFGEGKGLVFIPNIDGHLLKQGYYETISENKIKHIPYLLGSTRNDIMTSKEDVENGQLGMLYEGCRDFSFELERVQENPAYVYYFTRQLPGDDAGAFHSSELWYMFGTLHRCWRPFTEEDMQLSERMMQYWTNFMKNGDPNGGELPVWERCSAKNPFMMELC